MTGANRLLIGLGWAAVVLIACHRSRSPELVIHPRQRLEMRYLVWATLYSFLIPLKGTINLFDAAVLLVIFFPLHARRHAERVARESSWWGPPR